MKHELKTLSKFFQSVWVGRKMFEIRKNDRNFQVDDEIVLVELDPMCDPKDECYSGREVEGVITYLTDYEQKTGYVVFGFSVTWKEDNS